MINERLSSSLFDRVPSLLVLFALFALLTAVFARPAPLSHVLQRPSRFVSATRRPQTGRTYALDAVIAGGIEHLVSAGELRVSRNKKVEIRGWALDSRTLEPPAAILMRLDSAAVLRSVTRLGLSRPDVAFSLNEPEALKSGFDATLSLEGMKPGAHCVWFETIGNDGRRIVLPTCIHLLVN